MGREVVEHEGSYKAGGEQLPNRVIRCSVSEQCRAEHMLYWNNNNNKPQVNARGGRKHITSCCSLKQNCLCSQRQFGWSTDLRFWSKTLKSYQNDDHQEKLALANAALKAETLLPAPYACHKCSMEDSTVLRDPHSWGPDSYRNWLSWLRLDLNALRWYPNWLRCDVLRSKVQTSGRAIPHHPTLQIVSSTWRDTRRRGDRKQLRFRYIEDKKEGRKPKLKQADVVGIKTEMRAMALLSRGSTVRDCRQMDFQALGVSMRINGI